MKKIKGLMMYDEPNEDDEAYDSIYSDDGIYSDVNIDDTDCCAFMVAKKDFCHVSEHALWYDLCTLIKEAEDNNILLYTTGHEKRMENLLWACPYCRPLVVVKSNVGNYYVTMWLFEKHNGQ